MAIFSGIKNALFGKPSQGGTVTPSKSFSYNAGTLSPSLSFGGGTLSPSISRSGGLTSSVQNLFAPQAQNLTSLGGFTGDLLSQFGGNPQSLIAGFDPLQIQGQNMALNAPTMDTLNQARQGFTGALNTDVSQNPFFQSTIQAALNPFIRNFTQNIIPNIRSQAVGVGQPGGSREGIAQGMAVQGLQDKLGDIISNIGSNAFGQSLQARQGALNFAPQLAALGLLPAQTAMDVGGQRQALEQQRLMSPFTFGSNIQSLIGNPLTLSSSFGSNFADSLGAINQGTTSIGAIQGPSFSTSTGEVNKMIGGTPGILSAIGANIEKAV